MISVVRACTAPRSVAAALVACASIGCRGGELAPPPGPQPIDLLMFGYPPPYEVAAFDSELFPIRVHLVDLADEDRARAVVLPAVERAWAAEYEEMGWPAPPPDAGFGGDDRFDVYFSDEYTYGSSGSTIVLSPDDLDPTDGWFTVPTYVMFENTGTVVVDEDFDFVAAHELNHVSQLAIDASEPNVAFLESSANATAELAVDERDKYFGVVPDFQAHPYASVLMGSWDLPELADTRYQYGATLFPTFVEERFGHDKDGQELLSLWLACADEQDEPGHQETDVLDALAGVDPGGESGGTAPPEGHPTAASVYTEFAVWRMFAGSHDDGAHFEEGGQWGEDAVPAVEETLTLDEVDGYSGSPADPPYELGTSYFEIDLGGGTDQVLRVDVTPDDAEGQWGIAWAVWPASGPAVTGWTLAAPGELPTADVPLAGGVRAEFGVVNGGPPDLESAPPRFHHTRFTVDLSLSTGAPTGTPTPTGTTPSDPTPSDPVSEVPSDAPQEAGCGCASASASGWAAGLLGVLAVRRRRSVR